MRTGFPVRDEDILKLKIQILRELSASPYPREELPKIAMKHGITFDDAKALVERHGWPEARSMGRAADALEGKMPAPTAAGPAPKPTPRTNGTELLIADAKKSTKARTRRLATKVHEDLGALRDLMLAERKEAEAAQAKAEETARLKAEVAELERQLAEKKAALRPTAGKKPKLSAPKPSRPNVNKVIRAWAAEQEISCPGFGRIPAEVVEAYRAAHPSEGVSE